LKEIALQGSSLRELLVPSLDLRAPTKPLNLDAYEDNDSPTLQSPHLHTDVEIDIANSTTATQTTASNPSSMFLDNQLIRSWIRRYERFDPIKMIGDPELGLNPSQTRAVAMALGEKLSLIQGVRFFSFSLDLFISLFAL
jgi:hypothetical protein